MYLRYLWCLVLFMPLCVNPMKQKRSFYCVTGHLAYLRLQAKWAFCVAAVTHTLLQLHPSGQQGQSLYLWLCMCAQTRTHTHTPEACKWCLSLKLVSISSTVIINFPLMQQHGQKHSDVKKCPWWKSCTKSPTEELNSSCCIYMCAKQREEEKQTMYACP